MLGDSEAASTDLVHGADHAANLNRRRDAARLARQLCWVWIVPFGAFVAWYVYLSLIIAAFVAEAFEHDLPLGAVAIALGIPLGIFAVATGLGVVAASVGGRWLAASMPPATPWAVTSVAALAGGALALGAFFVLANCGG